MNTGRKWPDIPTEAAGLADTLSSERPFGVFAPTDEAFAAPE